MRVQNVITSYFAGVVLVLIGSVSTASATIVTDQAVFNSLHSGLTSFGFEGLVSPNKNTSISNPLRPGGVTGPTIISSTALVANSGYSNQNIPSASSDFIHSGFAFIGQAVGTGSQFSLNFAAGTNVVGFNFAELINGDVISPGSITITVFSGALQVFTDTYSPSNAGLFDAFFGVAGMGDVSEIIVAGTVGPAALDNLSVGRVPVPSTSLLFALGVMGLGFAKRQRIMGA